MPMEPGYMNITLESKITQPIFLHILTMKARSCSPSPRGSLSLPHLGNGTNPEGIPQQSPGLRGTSYPGCIACERANPKGVAPKVAFSGHNPVGVETFFVPYPRVARRLATLG